MPALTQLIFIALGEDVAVDLVDEHLKVNFGDVLEHGDHGCLEVFASFVVRSGLGIDHVDECASSLDCLGLRLAEVLEGDCGRDVVDLELDVRIVAHTYVCLRGDTNGLNAGGGAETVGLVERELLENHLGKAGLSRTIV